MCKKSINEDVNAKINVLVVYLSLRSTNVTIRVVTKTHTITMIVVTFSVSRSLLTFTSPKSIMNYSRNTMSNQVLNIPVITIELLQSSHSIVLIF